MKLSSLLLAGALAAATARGQNWLDSVEDHLRLSTKDGQFSIALSGLLDVEGYYIDQRPPGLIFKDQSFINPRATFFLDAQLTPYFYGFIQARLDRGFDPGYENFDYRLDEYFLRWTPLKNSLVNVQAGKFATVVGNWVQRHDSWQNPLITAPLPYENLTVASDHYIASSRTRFLRWRQWADLKDDWLPILWGPVYASGAAVLGTIGKFDYAFDAKNGALATRPDDWDPNERIWKEPTFSGRIAYHPSPAWVHGVSVSTGPYLQEIEVGTLPPGRELSDYYQSTLGYDVSYSRGHWQAWGELFLSRFDVPNVGHADLLSYYLEAKYKLTSNLYAAARWNQQFSGTIANDVGGREEWDRDMVRVDLALGYRFTRHLQTKLQYSFGHRDVHLQQGEQLVAAQVTLKF
jgi:hypothetical protein